MSKKWTTLLVVGVLAFALVPSAAWGVCKAQVITHLAYPGATAGPPPTNQDPIPPTAAQSATQITPTAAVAGGLNINNEGKTERVADVLVWDDGTAPGATSCFNITNTIRLTYNALLTNPTSVSAATTANFDVFDSAGVGAGLVISASSTVGLAGGGTPQTVITVTPLQKGTDTGDITTGAAGSAFRIKNLRIDATGITAGGVVTVTVSQNTGLVPLGGINTVGTAKLTISGGAGAGTITPAGGCIAAVTGGSGLQNSGTGLTCAGSVNFTEGFTGLYRVAGTACSGSASATCNSQVANDIATNATSFIFDQGTTLPSGVSMTWPATISTSNVQTTGAGLILTLRNTPTCSGPGSQCFAIYDTTKGDKGTAAALTLTTTLAGAAPNGVPTAGNPTVGVNIAATSGAGAGTSHVFFGPSESANAGCANDDVNAAAIPRYLNTCTGTTNPSRNIVSGTFFTVVSNQTALMLPYATNLFGYQTGIVISNTSAHGAAFTAATAQKGGLKFYFFPTNGTAFTLNTDVTTGGVGNIAGTRGLDANGQLAGGGIFAGSLNALLTAAGQPAGTSFDGYVIVVAGFQFAHGQVAVISPNGTAAYSNLLVIQNSGGARNSGTPALVTSESITE
jgi:hypothetical protein